MTVKIERLSKKLFKDNGLTLVLWRNHQGHFQATVERPDGHRTILSIAGSPSSVEHTMRAVGRDIQRFLTAERKS